MLCFSAEIRCILAGGALAVCTINGSSVRADTLGFDNVTTSREQYPIPAGYGGFQWANMGVIRGTQHFGTGYYNGVVSGEYVAFNGFGTEASVADGAFTFNSAYLTGAFRDGLNVTVNGYLGTDLLYTQTVVTSFYSPTKFTFDFIGINKLTFNSFGGTAVGTNPNTHFAMDDFTFNEAVTGAAPVPLPAAAWGGMALMGMIGAMKLRGRKANAAC